MTQSRKLSQSERLAFAQKLKHIEPYGKPRRVWVDDGHVYIEGHDGTIISMRPEVAIELGRLISNAGADSLVNAIMDRQAGDQGPKRPA